MINEPDLRGPAVIITGSLLTGYRVFGPFKHIDDACEWHAENTLEGNLNVTATVMLLEKRDKYPGRLYDTAEEARREH